MTFFPTLGIGVINNKNRKTKKCEIDYEFQLSLLIHFIKNFVNKMLKIIVQRINF